MSEQICVFCLELVNDYVCHSCNDYKGLMPIRDAEKYLGDDFPEEYRPDVMYGKRLTWL